MKVARHSRVLHGMGLLESRRRTAILLGLSATLVRWICARCKTRYVESIAGMGRAHPFFVRAGLPEAIADDEPDAVTLDDYLIERPSQTVLVRVRGDSMMDAGIFEGDLVVVEKRAAAQKGDIVVAIVDNQFTLKRLDIENGAFILRPENKAYPVIRAEGALEIFGVMVGLVRKI